MFSPCARFSKKIILSQINRTHVSVSLSAWASTTTTLCTLNQQQNRWKSTEASSVTKAKLSENDASRTTKASGSTTSNSEPSGPSPPGPTKLDDLRSMFITGDFGNREYILRLRSNYGDVVQSWAFQPLHHVFDPDIFMSILRQEWTYPYGAASHTWPFQVYYKLKSPDVLPMMLLQGEEWRKPRHTIQTHMFSPKAADSYQPGINNVVDDAAKYLQQHPYPDDLNRFLMNVSFEMLAQVLLDRRMGLINLEGDDGTSANQFEDEQQFVTSAVDAFHALGELLMKPPIENLTVLRCLPVWNRLERSMDQVWDIGMKWLIEAEEKQSDVAFVTKLAGQEKMDRQERLVNLVTLLQAGVDTTSNTLGWTLYELAKRPQIQERLRKEFRETILEVNENDGYSRKLMSNLPYFKAFLREVQRMNPAAAGTMRRFPFDVQAGDYVLKKDTIILWSQEAYGFDEELLGGDPNEFVPERWLAAEEASKLSKDLDPRKPVHVDGFDVMAPAPILSNPLLTTAFMVGPRMCVGARIAQNEIHSFVSKICCDFKLSMDPPEQNIERVSKLLTVPDPAPRIRFEPLTN